MPHADRGAGTSKVVFTLLVQHTRILFPRGQCFPWETGSQARNNKGPGQAQRTSPSYRPGLENATGFASTQALAGLEARDW